MTIFLAFGTAEGLFTPSFIVSLVTSGRPLMATTPLIDQVTLVLLSLKVSRPPAGMLTLMGKVFWKPGSMCSLPLAFGLTETSVFCSVTSCRTLRFSRASYLHTSFSLFSMHRSSALTSVASNSSRHDTVISPSNSSPNSKMVLGTVNETLDFGFLNLLKKDKGCRSLTGLTITQINQIVFMLLEMKLESLYVV
jgi:hypothetical protein